MLSKLPNVSFWSLLIASSGCASGVEDLAYEDDEIIAYDTAPSNSPTMGSVTAQPIAAPSTIDYGSAYEAHVDLSQCDREIEWVAEEGRTASCLGLPCLAIPAALDRCAPLPVEPLNPFSAPAPFPKNTRYAFSVTAELQSLAGDCSLRMGSLLTEDEVGN